MLFHFSLSQKINVLIINVSIYFFSFPERVHIHVYHTCLGQWGCHKLAQPWEIHEKETLVILQVALNPNILHNNNSITCGLLT